MLKTDIIQADVAVSDVCFARGSTSATSTGGRAFQELSYSSTSYRNHYLPSSSVSTDHGDIAQAYHNLLHQSPAQSAGLYSSNGSRTESIGLGATGERLSPTPRRARSYFVSPRPAGTGRCWSKLHWQQDLPGLSSARPASEMTEGREETQAAEAGDSAAHNRSEDAGWRRPYVPVGSIASGGLRSFPSTPLDSPRFQTLYASASKRPVILPSAGCQ